MRADVLVHATNCKAVVTDGMSGSWVEVTSNIPEEGNGCISIAAGRLARAKAIAAAINGELDAQFASGAEKVKYDFSRMAVQAEQIRMIREVLSGPKMPKTIGHLFLWKYTPEGHDFWEKERYSDAPLSRKARASLKAMVAQWDAEQAAQS